MSEENRIRDAADAVAGLVMAVPIYQDLAQPAVREVGSVGGRTVRALLSPIRGLVWSFEKIEAALEDALASKLAEVPEENLQTPNPTVSTSGTTRWSRHSGRGASTPSACSSSSTVRSSNGRTTSSARARRWPNLGAATLLTNPYCLIASVDSACPDQRTDSGW
jgi:hypothetical protein